MHTIGAALNEISFQICFKIDTQVVYDLVSATLYIYLYTYFGGPCDSYEKEHFASFHKKQEEIKVRFDVLN